MTGHERNNGFEPVAAGSEFSVDERRGLDAWLAQEPPDGFAQVVVDRYLSDTSDSGFDRRWSIVAMALLALTGLFAAMRIAGVGLPGDGRASIGERTRVRIGQRGIAVAEEGTSLQWQVSAFGSAEVLQDKGEVFYRVDSGAAFTVRTPAGAVEVVGTCFSVQVIPTQPPSRWQGKGQREVAEARAVVAVYEGEVAVAGPQGMVPVPAGHQALLSTTASPRVEPMTPTWHPAVQGFGQPQTEGTTSPRLAEREQAVGEAGLAGLSYQQLAFENARMRQQVQELTATENEPSPRDPSAEMKTYGLSEKELLELAERCEVRWDALPGGTLTPPTASDKDAEALQLSESERQAIDEVLRESNQQSLAILRSIYSEDAGDDRIGIDGDASQGEIFDTASDEGQDAKRDVIKRIASERAGLEPAPTLSSVRDPSERLQRMIVSSGDRLEQALAERIGFERARAYRDLKNGFGSKGAMYGCQQDRQ